MRFVKLFEDYTMNNKNNYKEFIAYHSSYTPNIKEFNFDDVITKSNSSTRIDGIFFTNTPQYSWGEYLYKVKIYSSNPAIFDLSKSRFDSLGVQEVFDAMYRGETSYLIDDLVEYGGMEQEEAELLVDSWTDSDLIVILNEVYATHDIEYIVPSPFYNGNTAKIKILNVIKQKE